MRKTTNEKVKPLYKGCIFDLDGTLADTLKTIVYFANKALEECGYHKIEPDRYRYLVGNGADELMKGMLKTVCGSYTEEQKQSLRAVYDRLYENDVMYLTAAYEGIPELLLSLKAAGIKIAVLSNKPHNVVEGVVSSLFGKDAFNSCYGQRPEVKRKPDPQGALLIAEEWGTRPSEILYIGDTNTDMQTGSAAGMDTVGVLWGFRDRPELQQSGAKYIVEKPTEIAKIVLGI